MASKFGWIDFSEKERRQMLDVVQLFSEQETRDELGIGAVRDAFADHFFPGTTTIQTRVKYMLFIPWIYLELERKRVSSTKIAAKARRAETDLIETLLKNRDLEGIIGREAKKNLIRLPSSIYWSGLGTWGIRTFTGSQDQYHRYLDRHYNVKHASISSESDEEHFSNRNGNNWHGAMPKPPKDFMRTAQLELNAEEASYLKERILLKHPESLFAELLRGKRLYSSEFPWEHPINGFFKDKLKGTLSHARNFSEMIHGAALLYNYMLSQAAERKDWEIKYENKLNLWDTSIRERFDELHKWYKKIDQFWNCEGLCEAKISPTTRSFVNLWIQLVFDSVRVEHLLKSDTARRLIAHRENQLKGPRARLSNQSALNRWQGKSGTGRLNYRWTIASRFIVDIMSGLKRDTPNA